MRVLKFLILLSLAVILVIPIAIYHLHSTKKSSDRFRAIHLEAPIILSRSPTSYSSGSGTTSTPHAADVVSSHAIREAPLASVHPPPAAKTTHKAAPQNTAQQAESYRKPVVIAVVTGHYLGTYTYRTSINDKCELDGIQLDCTIEGSHRASTADATWHHIPHVTSPSRITAKAHPHQLTVGFSMEGSEYYPMMNNKEFMAKFDIIMSYRLNSDVVTHYFHPPLLAPPKVPTNKKRNAVAYVNRNCAARNGRNEVVADLMKHFPVEAYGCLGKNTRVDKIQIFSESKFCIAMENSNSEDYVTEKLWHALEAGCLPIYMGAPNIVEDYLPGPKAIIMFDRSTMTGQSLAATLKQLSENDALYEEHMAWRSKPLSDLSPGYQRMMNLTKLPRPECQLCQRVAEKRYKKQSEG